MLGRGVRPERLPGRRPAHLREAPLLVRGGLEARAARPLLDVRADRAAAVAAQRAVELAGERARAAGRARVVERGEGVGVDADAVREEPREAPRVRDLGSTRVIQRSFNVSVPRARVPKKASTRRGRSER